MSSVDIPDIVIGRLPLYLRALSRLTLEGAKITSSHELGKRLGISSAQIRKDLSHFGEFGKQGTGYQVDYLTEQLRQILKVDKEWRVALVGVGDLGRALAHYNGFRDRGFRITMLFDNDPAKVSTMLDGFQIYDVAQMKDLIRQHGITLAMIAVPAEAAQQVADALVAAGVRGLLNYAPINLAVPEGVKVQYIDPVVHLQRITYYVEE
ncbi:MAG: redox-sensing transcriptional repressor Rex [Chloroflexi bacterium RBG_16_63_12]|jgi:redox-sensing transcriptional repressor|nr:Redox-sensing transcriptional repressor Rex [Anaerolineales bacterium]OGO46168.1 MAG: redox-sensing transcriptional repressor Rex [Chloroflexi bacterium RBG_16_63_12]